jgi:hypothetical protein
MPTPCGTGRPGSATSSGTVTPPAIRQSQAALFRLPGDGPSSTAWVPEQSGLHARRLSPRIWQLDRMLGIPGRTAHAGSRSLRLTAGCVLGVNIEGMQPPRTKKLDGLPGIAQNFARLRTITINVVLTRRPRLLQALPPSVAAHAVACPAAHGTGAHQAALPLLVKLSRHSEDELTRTDVIRRLTWMGLSPTYPRARPAFPAAKAADSVELRCPGTRNRATAWWTAGSGMAVISAGGVMNWDARRRLDPAQRSYRCTRARISAPVWLQTLSSTGIR